MGLYTDFEINGNTIKYKFLGRPIETTFISIEEACKDCSVPAAHETTVEVCRDVNQNSPFRGGFPESFVCPRQLDKSRERLEEDDEEDD